MKRNSICYLLLIIASIFTFNVYALPSGEFGVTVGFDGGGNTNVSYVHGGVSTPYHYYSQLFHVTGDSSTKLKSYCTWPGYYAYGGDSGTCTVANPSQFPTSYKLLQIVKQEGITDQYILDIAFRLAGMRDRVNNGTLIGNQGDGLTQAFYYTDLIIRGRADANQVPYKLQGGYMDQVTALMQRVGEVSASDVSNINPNTSGESTAGAVFRLDLLETGTDYKIYQVTSSSAVQRPNPTSTTFAITWEQEWNGTTGKIKVSLLNNSRCSGTINFTTNVSVGTESVIYACRLSRSLGQHYIAIGPSNNTDSFDVSLCAQPECITSGCGVVSLPTEFKEQDINNCCEQGAVTKVRQAALDELFCKDGTLNVEYYKEKCNADKYVTDTEAFCKQYCGTTGMYKLPGPTHAKAGEYFEFSTTVTGISGPILNQYKRCRTIIYFNVWYNTYKDNNDSIVRALNDYTYNYALYNVLKNASSSTETIQYTIRCPGAPAITHSVDVTKYSTASATYNKFRVENTGYSSMNIKDDGVGTITANTYYNKDGITAANNLYTSLVNQYPSCSVAGNTPGNQYEEALATAERNVQGALANYNTFVNNGTNLRDGLTECTGKANASGVVDTTSIRKRVVFKDEPDMKFSYSQTYLADNGKLERQELPVNFEKIGGKCAYKVYDTLDKPNRNSEDWNENWDILKIYDDRYSGNYGTGVLSVDTLKNIKYGEGLGNISTIKNGTPFYASKKFTTDAVGHMSCKWQDSDGNESYTLIPRGTVITKEEQTGKISELGGQYTKHKGTYHIVRTHSKGKFETYFTLSKFADGIFDDIIHNGGKTCSELYSEVNGTEAPKKSDDVNTTCYIEIENSGMTIYDCTEKKVIGNGSEYEKACCPNGNCYANNIIDYKEVDPKNIFPNEYSSNYAYNWLNENDTEAKAVLERIQKTAQEDKTYSPQELTYSFTLRPKDLKVIREYNASRVKDGGYADFNMECKNNENDQNIPLTECESRFLTAISGGKALDYGNNKKLEMNVSNVDIKKLRTNWK